MIDQAIIIDPMQENSIDELVALASERPEKTCEIFTPNDFYGHATILKQYAGLPLNMALQGVLPHGPSINHNIWEQELKAPLSHIYAISEEQRDNYKMASTREVHVIGSPVHYVERMIADEIRDIREHANGTVAFPAHSTHHLTTVFNQKAFIQALHELPEAMGPVRICLYWRDIQLGRHMPYIDAGFECLTAGHMFDHAFHYRMLKIFAAHKNSIANEMGSSSLLAASLGLTAHLLNQKTQTHAESDQFAKERAPAIDQPSAVQLHKSMLIPPGEQRPDQRPMGDIATGRNAVMEPEQLKELLLSHVRRPQKSVQPIRRPRTWEEEIQRLKQVVTNSSQGLPQHLVITPDNIPFRFHKPENLLEEHEVWQLKTVFPDLNKTDRPVVLDCGSDAGYTSIRLAEACPNASILCVEANPEKVKTIYQNFDARNIRSVDVVQKAVWIESGAVEFQIPSNENEKETIHVQAFRLRDLLKGASFDLVRLNVSNAILPIIQDCGELLQKVKHWILHFPSDAGDRDQLILLLAELSGAGFHMQINRIASKTNDESKLEILMTAKLTGGIEDCTPSCTHLE